MSVAPGHSFNSGAGLLAASALPSICHDTKIAFNECTFGYVPHAGSTYYASRMPGDFGTFIALTGVPITGKDAIKLEMADTLIEIPSTYEHEICDIIQSLDPSSAPYAREVIAAHVDGIHRNNYVDEFGSKMQAQIRKQRVNDAGEYRQRIMQHHHGEQFVNPRDRRPDVVAEADLKYKQILREYSQARHGQGGMGFFDHKADTFNQFDWYISYLRL